MNKFFEFFSRNQRKIDFMITACAGIVLLGVFFGATIDSYHAGVWALVTITQTLRLTSNKDNYSYHRSW